MQECPELNLIPKATNVFHFKNNRLNAWPCLTATKYFEDLDVYKFSETTFPMLFLTLAIIFHVVNIILALNISI